MRDFVRLLLGDGADHDDAGHAWDRRSRRARIEDSRDWCGSDPGQDAISQVADALRGKGGPHGSRRGRVVTRGRRGGPFGLF